MVAVLPRPLVILVAMVLDEPGDRVGWGSLIAALASLVIWTCLAMRQSHARRSLAVLSMVVGLSLGLVLVLLKASLGQ